MVRFNDSHDPASSGRFQRRGSPDLNARVHENIRRNLRTYSLKSDEEIDRRIEALERQWDLDRALEAALGGAVLAGVVLGLKKKPWLALTGLSALLLIQHAFTGRGATEALRWTGVRTRREIDAELFGLKAVRADLQVRPHTRGPERGSKELWG